MNCAWITTDGYSFTIDTDAGPPVNSEIKVKEFASKDTFYIYVYACNFTEYTTDGNLTDVTIYNDRSTVGANTYDFASILSINNCTYTVFNYTLRNPDNYLYADIGLSVN